MEKRTSHRDRCIPDVRNCDTTRGLGEKRKKKTEDRGNNEAEYSGFMKIRTKRFVW